MFTFPFSRWTGGIFFEHTHRLFASAVGLLTTVLAVWIWKSDSRRWMRLLGVTAWILVGLQGIFGGLRVTKLSIPLAIVHACTAQAFLGVLIVLAAALSPHWRAETQAGSRARPMRAVSWIFVAAIYAQLILGATMRHLKAGLAIGDFPLAFGHLIPPMWSPQIAIHFAHRVGAGCVTLLAIWLLILVIAHCRPEKRILVPALHIAALLVLQIALGAHIIWLAKAPVVTTLHVLNGAAILGTSLLLALRISCAAPAQSRGFDSMMQRQFREVTA